MNNIYIHEINKIYINKESYERDYLYIYDNDQILMVLDFNKKGGGLYLWAMRPNDKYDLENFRLKILGVDMI